MSDDWILRFTLFASGMIPRAMFGGLGAYGDTHALPWVVGFGTQAGVVLGMIGYHRRWWRS